MALGRVPVQVAVEIDVFEIESPGRRIISCQVLEPRELRGRGPLLAESFKDVAQLGEFVGGRTHVWASAAIRRFTHSKKRSPNSRQGLVHRVGRAAQLAGEALARLTRAVALADEFAVGRRQP